MKKVALIMFVVFILSAVPTFAADSGFGDKSLLKGKIVIYHGWEVKNFTDGNDATANSLLYENNAYNINDKLSPTQYVNRVYVRASTKTDGFVGVTFTFVDGTKEQIKINTTAGKGFYDYRDYYADVQTTDKMVKSFVAYGSPEHVVSEFDFQRGEYNPVNPSTFVITGVSAKRYDNTSAVVSWDAIESPYFKNYKLYVDGVLIAEPTTNSYTVSRLAMGKSYVIKILGVDQFGNSYAATTYDFKMPDPDTTPPATPTNVQVVPDRYTAQVSWTASPDEDTFGYFVYLNGTLLNATPTSATSFNITNLKLETEYTVAVAAVDTSGNLSPRTLAKSFKTLTLKTAPSQPTNLSAAAYNGAAALTWAPVQSAESYKVYQDGVNVMDVTSASVRVKSLQNGRQYKFAVSAVNDVDESSKSNEVAVTPSVKSVPDVSIGDGVKGILTPISVSTGYWFDSLWKLLAFTIGIPLAFYIANRMKGMFIA